MNAAKTALIALSTVFTLTLTSCGGGGGGGNDADAAPAPEAAAGPQLGQGGRLDGEWIVTSRKEVGEPQAEDGLRFEVVYGEPGARMAFEDGLLVSHGGQEANSFVEAFMFVNATITTPVLVNEVNDKDETSYALVQRMENEVNGDSTTQGVKFQAGTTSASNAMMMLETYIEVTFAGETQLFERSYELELQKVDAEDSDDAENGRFRPEDAGAIDREIDGSIDGSQADPSDAEIDSELDTPRFDPAGGFDADAALDISRAGSLDALAELWTTRP